jgi:phage I-like protein
MLRRATLSLHAAADTAPAGSVALCGPVAMAGDGGAPEWVQLLPAGEIATVDGRGPYRVRDAVTLAAASLPSGDRLVLDENHATDLAAPKGEPAPARGWIVALQARADGIWGKVEWTADGARLVGERAYRSISPVIRHLADGTVTAILRASLVNKPNLRGLAALHQENDMDKLLEQLLKALSLPAETTAEQLVQKVTALHAAQDTSATALQAALAPIAKAVGLAETADADAVLTGVQGIAATAAGKATPEALQALQAELTGLGTQLNQLKSDGAKKAAETFVDGAIRAGKVGVKPLRDHYIAMHMTDASRVEKEIGALPALGPSGALETPPESKNGEVSLNAEQRQAAKLLGVSEADYAKTLKAERDAAL